MALNKKLTARKLVKNRDNSLIIYIRNHKDRDRQIMKLFNCYLPLVKSLYRQYSIAGMEFDDWKQEALIVMLRVVGRYDYQRSSSFGSFYRTGLKNRLYDLLRKQNAKKRVPHQMLTSFESNDNLYFDTLRDLKATCPDNSLLVSETIKAVLDKCSAFEKRILIGIMNRRTFKELAEADQCPASRIINAFQRCRSKFKQLRDDGS